MKKTSLFEKKFKELFKPVENIDYDEKELQIGIKTELEHTPHVEIATIIAKQHLAEDPKYYSKLAAIHDEDENTVGGGALGPAAAVGHSELTATDWYAPDDYRRSTALGATYSRRGKVGKSKKKKTRKRKNKK